MFNTLRNNVVQRMGQSLNRDIVEEIKLINAKLTSGELLAAEVERQLQIKKELNKERIKALGMYIIQGGKALQK